MDLASQRRILYYLKVIRQAGLEEFAKVIEGIQDGCSQASCSFAEWQERVFMKSIENRGHVGRPRMVYQLTSQSKTVFPKSYSAIATHSLDFIERNMGKEGVEKVLHKHPD